MATIKKAQKGKKVSPTYKNLRMGVRNEQYQMTGQNKDVTPSSKDSARYRGGFEQGLKGMKGMPGEGNVEKMGRWEGQNAGKKTIKKGQNGMSAPKPKQSPKDPYKSTKTSPNTKSPISKGPYMFEKNVPSSEQMRKDWQSKEREMTTRKPSPNDRMPLKKGGKIKKAQVGRLVKKAIGTVGKDVEKKASNKTLATWRDASGKVYKRETEKSLERDALKKYKAETAPKNKMEAKIDKRERKIARDNDAYDKAVWESYQKNGGKTRKSMKMGGKVKKAQQGSSINPKFKMDMEKYKMKKASDSTRKVMKKSMSMGGMMKMGGKMSKTSKKK